MFNKICRKCYRRLLKLCPINDQIICRNISVVFYGSDKFSLETVKLLHKNFSQTKSDGKLIKKLDLVLSSKSDIISRFANENNLTTHDFPYELPPNVYDIGIVSSFGHLLPEKAVDACRLGMLNIHGSLLPRWRGAAPINYAVLNDDKITGVTIMKIKPKKFDFGDIVMQKEYKVEDRITAEQLKEELAPIGAQLLWKCISDLDNSLTNARPQPNEGITYAPKFDETNGLIEWSSMNATQIDRQFRAFTGFIDIYTHWTNGTALHLYDIIDPKLVATLDLNSLSGCHEPKPGFVFYHKKRRILCIKCADNTWSAFGSLALKGHKQMSAHQFHSEYISQHKEPIILGSNGILDKYNLLLTALITIAFQLFFFFIAYTLQFDKVTDFSGATNFLVLALMGLFMNGTHFKRQKVLTSLTVLWSLRLAAFLLVRVLIRGKDDRFDGMRSKFWPFLGFWVFQMLWVFTVSLPVTLNNAAKHDSDLNYLDYIGWTLWSLGFVTETVADLQKFNHNMMATDIRPPFLATGLWSVSRHPNYFGEILMWSGIFLSSCNAYQMPQNDMRWGYVSVLSPVLTFFLLMFLSGIPLAEQKSDERYGKMSQYIDYKRSTSPLIPLPPEIYRNLPPNVKQWLFFEYPFYTSPQISETNE